mmetsp:Transcript_11799/g.19923  ORF Transcript_11799/g.19923 Transcript_11799/m.19923 type:complete len:221 (+) Transcript_11799:405-1067(+)|eukprot:CAMPEP_0168625854 /NCGR_PEP_ID=MMETSP0449_2-20121227/10274_1 /TAXON_ID=1082188 /ORGANISM="Strombidium rassoulzadegani, Strain ras09" /LENGTH=220 /DNA_ID=CAMNT_0008667717 /DNA_START=381 /DNA_END=1043 /DNA_ORIENTATION=+
MMVDKYNVKSKSYFYGGHSLGGSSIASWAHSAAKSEADMKGVFVLGSYASKAIHDPVANYGVPFMTVGGELDGWMARITRIALSYDQMRSHDYGSSGLSNYTFPVVLIPGLNHASFLSGIPPSKVQETDLRAEISIEEAIDQISDCVSAFLTIVASDLTSVEYEKSAHTLDHYINEVTAPLLDPIVKAFRLEGASFFSGFEGQSPVVTEAQEFVARNADK